MAQQAQDTVVGAAQTVQGAAGDAYNATADTLGQAGTNIKKGAQQVTGQAQDAGAQAQDKAGDVASGAQKQGEKAADGAKDMVCLPTELCHARVRVLYATARSFSFRVNDATVWCVPTSLIFVTQTCVCVHNNDDFQSITCYMCRATRQLTRRMMLRSRRRSRLPHYCFPACATGLDSQGYCATYVF
jgi:hypothetical protein